MAFLAPWMLLGCLAAAIPVILHLIHRNRPAPIQWAAMDFLLQSIRETRSASRLRDLILLVCRMLVLVLAALAIARPLANRFLSGGGRPLGRGRWCQSPHVDHFRCARSQLERGGTHLFGARIPFAGFGNRLVPHWVRPD
jgi:hypothetical protein